jgi:hypothetical protein
MYKALNSPSIDIIPHTIQLIKLKPTLPDPAATPFGEIKIPDPSKPTFKNE